MDDSGLLTPHPEGETGLSKGWMQQMEPTAQACLGLMIPWPWLMVSSVLHKLGATQVQLLTLVGPSIVPLSKKYRKLKNNRGRPH